MLALTIIFGAATIVSLGFNVWQFIKRREDHLVSDLEKATLKENMTAAYRAFHHIATFCDDSRITYDNNPDTNITIELLRFIEKITGIVDDERIRIRAYCQEHLDYSPVYEHPGEPINRPPGEKRPHRVET